MAQWSHSGSIIMDKPSESQPRGGITVIVLKQLLYTKLELTVLHFPTSSEQVYVITCQHFMQ